MDIQRIARSRWLPAALALAFMLVAGFFAYKVGNRTRLKPDHRDAVGAVHGEGAGTPDAWPGRKPGDFRHFYYAGRAIGEGSDIYTAGESGYIYPPLFAVLVSPVAQLPPLRAERVWALVNSALIALILGVALRDTVRRFEIPNGGVYRMAVVLAGLLLTVEQVRWELEMGQSDTLVMLGFALGLLWLERYPVLSGIAVGLAANVKYQTVIAIPYLLVRRRFVAAGAAAAATVAWALLPALVVGWERNLQYLGTALGRLGWVVGLSDAGADAHMHPVTWNASVSLTSAAARVAETLGLGTAAALAGIAVLAGATLGGCWLAYRMFRVPLIKGRSPAMERELPLRAVVALEWYGLIVAVLAFGPQSMVRHSVLLLPMNVLIAALVLAPRVGVRIWPLVLGATIFQLGSKLPPGEDAFERALEAWRYVGGTSWCMLAMYLSALWIGLEYAKAAAERRPVRLAIERGVGAEKPPAMAAMGADL